jgi:flagellar motor switch protein FliG
VGKFYIDKCLSMGCAISCSVFEKFSTFPQCAVEEARGLHSVDHYLDDFLLVGILD